MYRTIMALGAAAALCGFLAVGLLVVALKMRAG
jgi:hypothetical protein